jgi:peptide deformylase
MRLSILQYGDPILRTKGKPIDKIDACIRELAQNMVETMHAASGVGLAAQQIGEALQLTVLDVSEVEDRPSTMKLNGESIDPKTAMPLVLINPRINLGDETEMGIEGCLSIPEVAEGVRRAAWVMVRATDLRQGDVEIEATGLLARALQHEIDHLNGILFTSRLSSLAKARIAGQLKRLQRETQRNLREHRRSTAGASAPSAF